MLVPSINPDEFGPGYMIRLGKLNGHSSYKTTSKAILAQHSHLIKDIELIALQISTVLNIDVEKYCQQHTLLPIHRSLTNIHDSLPHGSKQHPYAIKRYGHFGLIENFKFCKSCVHEDIEYLGYSFYRKSHQFPGAYFCSKHKAANQLLKVPISRFSNPDEALHLSISERDFDSNSIINRYFDLLDGVSNFQLPVDPNKLVTELQQRARSKNLRWSQRGQGHLFSDFLLETVPNNWLATIIPGIKNKKHNYRFSSIDGVLSPQNTTIKALNYVLALAALFESSDEALTILQDSNYHSHRAIEKRFIKNQKWEALNLEALYLANKGSCAEISRKLGIHPQQVKKRLHRKGLPLLGNTSKKTLNAYNYFVKGGTMTDAIKLFELDGKDFEEFMRKMCIKINPKVEYDTQEYV